MTLIVCNMPMCQTTAGCQCLNWATWAGRNVSEPYKEGCRHARRSANPYPVGSWDHEQWNKGYDESSARDPWGG